MESNITDQQYFGTDLHLSEPHFDEEATLLSARRVVPLGNVRAKTRSGRRLGFALAMVFAVMAGAFAATLIYRQRGQKQATAVVETGATVPAESVPEGQALPGAGGAMSDTNASSGAESVGDVAARQTHPSVGTTETRRSAPPSSRSVKAGRAEETVQNAVEYQPDEKELRRAERIEARHLRRNAEREARKEARGHKRQSSDELLRIREIFEGSPRP